MPKKRAASPAQIAANKANAQKSTGPKSADGKTRVSQNATTHGLLSENPPAPPPSAVCDLSQDTTLPSEHEEFEAVLAGLTHDHQPQTTTEAILIERLAQLNHRLRRSLRIETAMLDSNSNNVIAHRRRFPDPDTPKNDPKRTRDNWTLSGAYTRSSAEIHLLAHYESRLSRDFARTLTQLYGVKNLREQTQQIPQRPQHPGTDLTVPSGCNSNSSSMEAPPRVDSPVCPPSRQAPNDSSIDSRPTNLTSLVRTVQEENEQTNPIPLNLLIRCLLPTVITPQTTITPHHILGQEETRS